MDVLEKVSKVDQKLCLGMEQPVARTNVSHGEREPRQGYIEGSPI